MQRWLVSVLAVVAAASVTTALSVEPAGASRSKVNVVAAFYPVAFAAKSVGGTRVGVTNLTPAGAEPHDLELNSDQLDRLLGAKVAFVLGSDFQPAVEKAAKRRDGPTVELLPKLVDARGKKVAKNGQTGGLDPHVWLDPVLMSQLVGEVERGLSAADPKGAATYERKTQALQDQLAALDARYRDRLTGCARNLLVTSHEAFGYLATRYGLQQQGVAGLSPGEEPEPALGTPDGSVSRSCSRRRSSWSRRSPPSLPGRSRCCPTLPICSPTPSASAWRWRPSASPTTPAATGRAPSGCTGSRSSPPSPTPSSSSSSPGTSSSRQSCVSTWSRPWTRGRCSWWRGSALSATTATSCCCRSAPP